MANSKKIIQNEAADGTVTFTSSDATIGDIFTTLVSTNESVNGFYGLAQRGLLLVGGMVGQSALSGGGFKFWKNWSKQ